MEVEEGVEYGEVLSHPYSIDNWLVCHNRLIYGFEENLRDLMRVSDIIIFYVMKSRCRDPDYALCLVGAYEVTSDWFREYKPLWPDE